MASEGVGDSSIMASEGVGDSSIIASDGFGDSLIIAGDSLMLLAGVGSALLEQPERPTTASTAVVTVMTAGRAMFMVLLEVVGRRWWPFVGCSHRPVPRIGRDDGFRSGVTRVIRR
jgi:hypothetical protein